MRVLLVSSELPPFTRAGGIGSYVRDTAPALHRTGVEVHVLCCGTGFRARTAKLDGVSVHMRPLHPAAGPYLLRRMHRSAIRASLANAVERALRSLPPFDLIEYPDWGAEGARIPRDDAIRLVHLHTSLAVTAKYDNLAPSKDLQTAIGMEQVGIARANAGVAPSHAIADVTRDVPSDLEVIPLGIDTGSWVPLPAPSDAVILYVGRLTPLKRPDLVLSAASRCPGARVVLAGPPTPGRRGRRYRAELQALAARLGVRADFVGHADRPTLTELYRKCRVVLVPSDFESFSLVVLEALASGRPVVTTNTVGSAELVAGHGATVVPATVEGLGDATGALLENPREAEAQGQLGAAFVAEHLDVSNIALRREAHYRRLVDER